MTVDPNRWRRDAASVGLSLVVHGLALFLLVLLALQESNSATEAVGGDVITIAREESPPPTIAPTLAPTVAPVQPTPPPVTPPPVFRRPIVRRPIEPPHRVPTPVPDKPELARIVKDATPQPRVVPTLAPTAIPTVVPTSAPTVRPTAVPTIVAIVTPIPTRPPTAPPTLRPTIAPTVPPTVAPTAPPTIVPTVPPTVRPTVAPTVAPTARPTIAPTVAPTIRPTAAPTVPPTARPTIAPTAAPTTAPTAAPTARPTVAPTARATAAPTTAPTSAPTAVPTRVVAVATAAPVSTASPGPPRPPAIGSPRPNAGVGNGSPIPRATGAGAPASSRPAPAGSPAANPASAKASAQPGLNSINAKLKGLDTGGNVDYTPQRVKMGDPADLRDAAFAAHEGALAPPPEILAQTFGILRQKRTLTHPDSIAYIFERTSFLGIPSCKAYKITEMPFAASRHPQIGSVPIGNKQPDVPDNSRVLSEPTKEIVTITPCNEKDYTPVTPGSLKTPVPRRDAFGPGPTPAPKATLAPGR